MDLQHSQLTIKALARFHALGIACKRHRPTFFADQVLQHAKVVPFVEKPDQPDVFDAMFDMMCRDARIAEHSERLGALILGPDARRTFFEYVAEEPWLSVVHLDFWTNNVLFRKDAQGRPVDVKFIDFQAYAYNSPLRDLPYFLCTSTSREVMTRHFDDLLDLYHETLLDTLRRMQVEVEAFGRKSFEGQLVIDAKLEFFHCILAIKFFCAEMDKSYDPSQIDSVVIYSNINKRGYDKWYDIIATYMKKGWL